MTRLLLSLTVFAAAALAACSPGPEVPQVDPTQGIALLAGTYTFTITAEDAVAFNETDPNAAAAAGDWVLVLDEEGRFEVTQDGLFIANGGYTVTNDQLALGIQQVCQDCDCVNSIYRYFYLLEGNELRLAHIAGTCGSIEKIVTAHPLVRLP